MLAGLAVASPEASANHRTGIVNGQLLGPQDIDYLDIPSFLRNQAD